MGKTNVRKERTEGNAKRGAQRNEGEMTNKPFKDAFKGLKIGPVCLKCQKVIDTRSGSSLVQPKGARVTQRQGYLHDDCLKEESLKFYEEEYRLLPNGRRIMVSVKSIGMEVPVLSAEEIRDILSSKGIEQ